VFSMQFSRFTALFVAVSLLLSPPALAEGEDSYEQDVEEETLSAEQLKALHHKMDQDGNGKVSMQEILDFTRAMGKRIAFKDIGPIMEEIDTNKDGKLSLEEHLADIHNQAEGGDEQEMKEVEERKKTEQAKHAAADTNGDGFVDKEELTGLFYPETQPEVLKVTVAATMRQKDSNADGKLSPHEFWQAEDGGDDLSEEEKADFQMLDKDGDGALSAAEVEQWESGLFHSTAAMKKLIEIADTDNDMHVTGDELAAAASALAPTDAHFHLLDWAEHPEL
jgi:Ca2+-binding EF-hand superfamily protein